jgi:Uma2 family endonuclease
MTAYPLREPVHYPESDDEPMGETGIHVREIMDLLFALQDRYRDVEDVCVCGDQFIYYVEGNPRYSVVPDSFVAKGVPAGLRRTYKVWEEGRPPCWVVEITSPSTWRIDAGKKKELYERIGVEGYFQFDPLGETRPPLQGYRLVRGRYEPIEPGPDGSLEARTLGLRLRREGDRLRLIDAASGTLLLRMDEVQERRAALESRTEALEDENARLRRELEALRGGA